MVKTPLVVVTLFGLPLMANIPTAPAQSAQSAQPQFLSKVVSHQKLELTRPPRDIQFTRPPRDMEVPSRRISGTVVPPMPHLPSPPHPNTAAHLQVPKKC